MSDKETGALNAMEFSGWVEADYCGSGRSYGMALGTSSWNYEYGDIAYDEIPDTGTGNVWYTQMWWTDDPTNPCDDDSGMGDYVGHRGWEVNITALPSEKPDGQEVGAVRVHNPVPDNEDWSSNELNMSVNAGLGPFGLGTNIYSIDLTHMEEVSKVDSSVSYESLNWTNYAPRSIDSCNSVGDSIGVKYKVSSRGLDGSIDYAPNGVDYVEEDIAVETIGTMKFAYEYVDTQLYETAETAGYPMAKLKDF